MKRWIPVALIAAVGIALYAREPDSAPLRTAWSGASAIPAALQANAEDARIDAKAAVLLDADAGKWLYEQNADRAMAPASMSKMMTELIVLDRIQSGKLRWETKVKVSAYAAQVGGSGMGLAEGQRVSVQELFAATAVHSANDAAVALAEAVAGSERKFVKLMNAKAEAIGLSGKTRFANATGLPRADLKPFADAANDSETKMTARDVARLAAELVRSHPDVLDYTRLAEVPSADGFPALAATNEMLPGQRFATKGNEGLKTGYTAAAGYCFAGSFRLDGKRYITVVMGAATPEARFQQTDRLLKLGLGV